MPRSDKSHRHEKPSFIPEPLQIHESDVVRNEQLLSTPPLMLEDEGSFPRQLNLPSEEDNDILEYWRRRLSSINNR